MCLLDTFNVTSSEFSISLIISLNFSSSSRVASTSFSVVSKRISKNAEVWLFSSFWACPFEVNLIKKT